MTQEQRNESAQTVEEASLPKIKPLKFNLLYNTSDSAQENGDRRIVYLEENLGAEVQLVNREWKTFLDTRHQGTYMIAARAAWCADYNELSSFLNMVLSYSSQHRAL